MDGSVLVGTLQLNGGSHVEFSSEDGVRAQLLSLPIREVGERMQALALGPWGLSVTPHEGLRPLVRNFETETAQLLPSIKKKE